MNENNYSVTVKPEIPDSNLLTFSDLWNAMIPVELITPYQITNGPISYKKYIKIEPLKKLVDDNPKTDNIR